MQKLTLTLSTVLIFAISTAAHAYVGPGLGLGTIGVIVGVLVSVFLALFAIIWYPLKKFLKKRKAAQEDKEEQ